MKLSTPTSSSSSDASNESKWKTTTTKCLTAIYRFLLCSNTLPKEPLSPMEELDSSNSVITHKDQNLNDGEAAISIATTNNSPGVVARLMGLESMGEIQTLPYASKPSSSLSRSKSMNYLDYLGECNEMKAMQKRVNSTLSFREPPNFLLSENEKFLVLSFENEGESSGALNSINERKKLVGCDELKKKMAIERSGLLKENMREKILIDKRKMMSKKGYCGNVGNGYNYKLQDMTNTLKALAEKKCFDSKTMKLAQPVKCKDKQAVIGKKQMRRKKTICKTEKKVESECKLDDSSSGSALEFLIQSRVPEWKVKALKALKALRKKKHGGSKKKGKLSKEYTHVWDEVYKLTKDELNGKDEVHESWMKKQCDLGSISDELESEIFDQLLNEMIGEFVGLTRL